MMLQIEEMEDQIQHLERMLKDSQKQAALYFRAYNSTKQALKKVRNMKGFDRKAYLEKLRRFLAGTDTSKLKELQHADLETLDALLFKLDEGGESNESDDHQLE